MAPVGIRCPEHSGRPQGVQRVTRGAQRAAYEGVGSKVTRGLIALNILVYVAELLQGSGVSATKGSIYQNGALLANGVKVGNTLAGLPAHVPFPDLVGVAHGEWWRMQGGGVYGVNSTIYAKGVLWAPFIADGEYWRLITAAFLHYGPLHLILNMLGLWWFGSLLEQRIGSGRFLLLYLVSGLAGSAGALVVSPTNPTVGASGAIFGILGAGLVLEHQRDYVFGGSALGVIVLNLVFTFSVANISIGGHIGGLLGGAACAFGLSRFGRAHIAYGRAGLLGYATIVAVGAASFLLAYWKTRGYA